MPAPKRKNRHARFNPRLAAEICRRLAAGESLASICRRRGMPDRRTIARWRAKIPGFHAEFAFARDEGGEVLIREILAIADTPQIGDTVAVVQNHLEITRSDLLAVRRREVASRLRLLAHWNPRPRHPGPVPPPPRELSGEAASSHPTDPFCPASTPRQTPVSLTSYGETPHDSPPPPSSGAKTPPPLPPENPGNPARFPFTLGAEFR